MVVAEGMGRIDGLFCAYCAEKEAIQAKLARNSQLSDEKRGRLQFRLGDINRRLIPQLEAVASTDDFFPAS